MKATASGWTTPADVKAQVQKLWNRGQLLASMVSGEPRFPLRLPLKCPDSRELSDRFADVSDWIGMLSGDNRHYRIGWRQVNHRILGANKIPAEIWIDSLDDALALIGQRKAANRFAEMLVLTECNQPLLSAWLQKRPLLALELSNIWPRLLDIVGWLERHPKPGIYLRQIDLPGVHTKLIEAHRGVLAELLDLVLPPDQIDRDANGTSGFCRRYGFRDKPARLRFRLLDPTVRLLPLCSDQDITLTENDFSDLNLPMSKIFITENEINFLTFPPVSDAVLIFGSGYGFDALASAKWLLGKSIWYWGDIDTHGFAILDQLRSHFPHAISLLMDHQTLMDHQELWGIENQPETKALTRLSDAESLLYDQLRKNLLGNQIRLEQERIGFDYLLAALRNM